MRGILAPRNHLFLSSRRAYRRFKPANVSRGGIRDGEAPAGLPFGLPLEGLVETRCTVIMPHGADDH